eukprot:6176035-Pleurochrysis_carterae.AAC.2
MTPLPPPALPGVQYNYDSISPAENWLHAIYGESDTYDLLLKVIIFMGTIVGMICFGAMGDLVGRNAGLLVCQYIQVAGALLQGVVPWGGSTSVYCLLITVRTFIGIGAGGVYPLAAAKAAEDSTAVDPVHKAQSVAWAFLWRNVGAIFVWVNFLMMYYTIGAHCDLRPWTNPPADYEGSQFSWRYVLMFGALAPALVAISMHVQPHFVKDREKKRIKGWNQQRASRASSLGGERTSTQSGVAKGLWENIKDDPGVWRKMLGTGGSWFFFDWSFYGNHMLQGKILKIILPGDPAVGAWENISLNAVGFVTVLCVIPLFSWSGVRWMQFWGFGVTALTTLLLGLLWPAMIDNINGVLLVLYYLQYASYWVANTTTYVMSSLVYKPSIRGTLNGLSAACGKVGAIIGVTLFTLMLDSCEDDDSECTDDKVVKIMYTSMTTAICGMMCTLYGVGVEPTGQKYKANAQIKCKDQIHLNRIPHQPIEKAVADDADQ